MGERKEGLIYDQLVRELTKCLKKGSWRIQRIETSTGAGVPDCYFRHKNYSCWIETKRDQYVLSKEQFAWYWVEHLAGGEVWLYNGSFIQIDSRMLDYRTLGSYLKSIKPSVWSTGQWLGLVGSN